MAILDSRYAIPTATDDEDSSPFARVPKQKNGRWTWADKPADVFTELETVQYDVATDIAALNALTDEEAQQGDERLLPDGYIYEKQPDGTWTPDVTKLRKYPDEAARLARTGFTPEDGEQVEQLSDNTIWSVDSAADNTQDRQIGGGVPVTTIRDAATATDAESPTELAVRTELDKAIPKTDIADTAEADAGTDPAKVINVVEAKRLDDLRILKSDIADTSQADAGTDANKVLNVVEAKRIHDAHRAEKTHLKEPSAATVGKLHIGNAAGDDYDLVDPVSPDGTVVGVFDPTANTFDAAFIAAQQAGYPAFDTSRPSDQYVVIADSDGTPAQQLFGNDLSNGQRLTALVPNADPTNAAHWHISTARTDLPVSAKVVDYENKLDSDLLVNPKELTDWIESLKYHSYHLIEADFSFTDFLTNNPAYAKNSSLFVANRSHQFGYKITYPATHGLVYKLVGKSGVTNIAAGLQTDFTLKPSQVVVMAYDDNNVYASVSEARDKGDYNDNASLAAVPVNSILRGDIATVGASRFWLYNDTSTEPAGVNVIVPLDAPAQGRWVAEAMGTRSLIIDSSNSDAGNPYDILADNPNYDVIEVRETGHITGFTVNGTTSATDGVAVTTGLTGTVAIAKYHRLFDIAWGPTEFAQKNTVYSTNSTDGINWFPWSAQEGSYRGRTTQTALLAFDSSTLNDGLMYLVDGQLYIWTPGATEGLDPVDGLNLGRWVSASSAPSILKYVNHGADGTKLAGADEINKWDSGTAIDLTGLVEVGQVVVVGFDAGESITGHINYTEPADSVGRQDRSFLVTSLTPITTARTNQSTSTAEFARHSTTEQYAKLTTAGDLTLSDSEINVGYKPQLRATHVVAAQGAGGSFDLAAGVWDVELWFRNMTQPAFNVGFVEASNVVHRIATIADPAVSMLSASAAATDTGAVTITALSNDDMGDLGRRVVLRVDTPAAGEFRLGAYLVDSTAAWEADMSWFISEKSATDIDLTQPSDGKVFEHGGNAGNWTNGSPSGSLIGVADRAALAAKYAGGFLVINSYEGDAGFRVASDIVHVSDWAAQGFPAIILGWYSTEHVSLQMNANGSITPANSTSWGSNSIIRIHAVAAGFAIPNATTSKTKVDVSVSGDVTTINNGAASGAYLEGAGTNHITVDVPAGSAIDKGVTETAINAIAGVSAVVDDPYNGHIGFTIAEGTGNVVLPITLIAATNAGEIVHTFQTNNNVDGPASPIDGWLFRIGNNANQILLTNQSGKNRLIVPAPSGRQSTSNGNNIYTGNYSTNPISFAVGQLRQVTWSDLNHDAGGGASAGDVEYSIMDVYEFDEADRTQINKIHTLRVSAAVGSNWNNNDWRVVVLPNLYQAPTVNQAATVAVTVNGAPMAPPMVMQENTTAVIALPVTAGNEIATLSATGATVARIGSSPDLVEVVAGTTAIDITFTEQLIPTPRGNAAQGWKIDEFGNLECWGVANSGIVTLPNGLSYANTNYNLQATVMVGSNGDHTNDVHFTAKGYRISTTQFRLKEQYQYGGTTTNATWPIAWRTMGQIA